jgi:hypothetical protein
MVAERVSAGAAAGLPKSSASALSRSISRTAMVSLSRRISSAFSAVM